MQENEQMERKASFSTRLSPRLQIWTVQMRHLFGVEVPNRGDAERDSDTRKIQGEAQLPGLFGNSGMKL